MADPAPTKPSDPTPTAPSAPGNQPDPQTPAPAAPSATVDLTKLSGDQLEKVLENQELWNLPRLKELREQAAEAKKLKADVAKAEELKLTEDKKFEELASKKGQEVETLTDQLKSMTINQALMAKLSPLGVLDLDGALKLVDRSKLDVDDNGNAVGIDEAVTALQTDKSYLFKPGAPSPVGAPMNPGNGGQQPSGPSIYKRSQITPAFYREHSKEIDEAYSKGLVEDDGPAPSN